MLDLIVLAFALSMDAFAVSVGLGSKHQVNTGLLALKAALYFGLFQGLMPLIGALAGQKTLGWIQVYLPWIAFVLLVIIGIKMLYESFQKGVEDKVGVITHRVLLILAIATSIDAIAAGFALPLLAINLFLACSVIGIVTFILSVGGVFIGDKFGTWLEARAEALGGLILILLGFKLLLSASI